jgi:hypothetical protein
MGSEIISEVVWVLITRYTHGFIRAVAGTSTLPQVKAVRRMYDVWFIALIFVAFGIYFRRGAPWVFRKDGDQPISRGLSIAGTVLLALAIPVGVVLQLVINAVK